MNCINHNLGPNGNSCNDGLRYIEQIALNKAGIDCLGGRMCRAESDIKDRYTKAELDRMLASKMERSGYNPPACNSKPNICDHYSKEELDQLLAEIACKCDTYSKEELDNLLDKIACACDCYSKAEVDELLENKANVGSPDIHELPLTDIVQKLYNNQYWKTQSNVVTVTFAIYTKDQVPRRFSHDAIATLPRGFLPSGVIEVPINLTNGVNTCAGHGFVNGSSREITAWSGGFEGYGLIGNFSFIASR